jgi:hypothetical protein
MTASLADRAEAGFAELLEDLAGGFITDHVVQSSGIDSIKSNLLDKRTDTVPTVSSEHMRLTHELVTQVLAE